MPFENIAKQHFDAAEKQQARQLLDQLKSLLRPKLARLNSEERQKYGSINEDNKKLVNKVRDFQRVDPQGAAPEVDWTEFEQDFESREFLSDLLLALDDLVYELSSTKILHDHDNYQDALADYAYAKYRAERGISGAERKLNELKQFFSRSGNSNTKPPATDD